MDSPLVWVRRATGNECHDWVNPQFLGIHGRTSYVDHPDTGWTPIPEIARMLGLPYLVVKKRLEVAILYSWTLQEFLSGEGEYRPPPHPQWMQFYLRNGKPGWRIHYDGEYRSAFDCSKLTGVSMDVLRKRFQMAILCPGEWTPDEVVWGKDKTRPIAGQHNDLLVDWLNGFAPCFGLSNPNPAK